MVGELSKRQIDDLLKEQRFVRLGCHVGGKTYIVPVSFALDGDRLVGQTTPGLKVEMMRQNPEVCVQVDDIEDLTNWRSAIVWGTYEELSGAEKAAAMGLLIDRYGEAFGEAEREVRRGRETAPPRVDGRPSVAVVYAIRIRNRSGRFESTRDDARLTGPGRRSRAFGL